MTGTGTMTTATELAARLRAMPTDALVSLLVRRRPPAGVLATTGSSAVTDFFDLADALRAPESVDRALEQLPRATLIALRDPEHADDADLRPAVDLALVDGVELDDAVAARLAARPDLRPDDAPRPASTAPAPDAGREHWRTAAAERAFTTMTEFAELVRRTADGVVHELAKGGIGAPLARQLAADSGTEATEVPAALRLLVTVGFLQASDPAWTITPAGRDWLLASWPDRWVRLVANWRDGLPAPVRCVLDAAGDDWSALVDLGRWEYPGAAAWLDQDLALAASTASAVGLLVDGHVTPTGRALLDACGSEDERALAAARADLPRTVDGVYLQHDLTVIAPGPLAPADDDALRALADIEAPGLASRYRISEESVRRALLAGIDRHTVLGTLERLAATEVPQPVRYLVEQASARAGSIVVDVDTANGGLGSVVRGPADQLDLIGVDAELRHFAWERRDLTTLSTRYPVGPVATELEEQRYPAVLAAGARPDAQPGPPGRRRTTHRPLEEQARDLVERLRVTTERGDREPEQEWMGRQIDLAVRGKLPIRVVVRMPDGTEQPFTMVPTTVSGGRVRGRDTKADVERTLPLSLVVAVENVV